MKAALVAAAALVFCATSAQAQFWINEFHYDDTGTDANEFVEIVGPAGTDLTGWTIELYNGLTGCTYDSIDLTGTVIDAEQYGLGAVAFLRPGLLDTRAGIALVDSVSNVRDFVSYEGTFVATCGAANGLSPSDTGLTESSLTSDLDSIQLRGSGDAASDFTWFGALLHSRGSLNVNQNIVLANPVDACATPATPIHAIQGSGPASPQVGAVLEVEGIVTGDFQAPTGLGGFFMQEETAHFDGDPTTSEGLFVSDNNTTSVSPGDTVRVRGEVAESGGLTELTNAVSVTVCPATGATAPVPWSLPVADPADWEWVEGMEVFIDQTLYATNQDAQVAMGRVDLSVGGPLDSPTNVVAPGLPSQNLQDLNDRSRIRMDDGSGVVDPSPPPYLGVGGTLRTGDTLPNLTGVVGLDYAIHPTQAVSFTRSNPRPGVPAVGGRIQVAGFNVDDYFTTLGNGGATTAPELDRQVDKIVAAILGLDAEVIGLVEIENDAGDAAAARLVAELDGALGIPGTYAYIATGVIGNSGIPVRNALLYKPAAVTPLGNFAVVQVGDRPHLGNVTYPALVQSFTENATGEVFTVAVTNLTSRAATCSNDPVGDQGSCNLGRTQEASTIVSFLASDPTGSGDGDFLIVGDLNAYAQEDPIVELETTSGYTDLIEAFVGTGYGAGAYSFNDQGQSGDLDHGLSSATLTPQVTGAACWHVNADEPSGLGYRAAPPLYTPDAFRSSDHDPVLIGLDLSTPDADGDGVEDFDDNCVDVANPGQEDTDGDGFGNACDCDFDQDGFCSIADFNFFLPAFQSTVDPGNGTDMNGDGAVGIADFNLFLPGFACGSPACPACTYDACTATVCDTSGTQSANNAPCLGPTTLSCDAPACPSCTYGPCDATTCGTIGMRTADNQPCIGSDPIACAAPPCPLCTYGPCDATLCDTIGVRTANNQPCTGSTTLACNAPACPACFYGPCTVPCGGGTQFSVNQPCAGPPSQACNEQPCSP